MQQARRGGARERVAEGAERGDGGVQEAGLRRDVEGGEEGGCFGGEEGGRWEGGVGVGEGGVRVGCGGEGVVAGAEPEDVPGCWRGPVGLGARRWGVEVREEGAEGGRGEGDLGRAEVDVPVDVVFDYEGCGCVAGEEGAEGVQVAEPGEGGAAG